MGEISKKPTWARLVIDGMGLLGGSVALAARKAGAADSLVGLDLNAENARRAVELGQIDRKAADLADALADRTADERPILILAAVPVNAIGRELAAAIGAVRQAGITQRTVVLTDTGSVQSGIFDEISRRIAPGPWPENVVYYGSHPIAGSEKSGPDAASASLFTGKTVVITTSGDPSRQRTVSERDIEAFALLTEFWESLGARVRTLLEDEHDAILAETSHLAHLTACALAGTVSPDRFAFAGSGLADMTRLAAGNPDLWTVIFERNRLSILGAVERLEETLARWKSALNADGIEAIKDLLTEAKRRRDALGN